MRVMAFVLVLMMMLTGCGSKEHTSDVEPLKEMNKIPEDGIITKEQFETIDGEDMDVQFTGETEDGIQYTWIYHAKQIQNPQDQVLNLDFSTEGLDDVKKQANDANDALKITMHGQGVIAVPTLIITLPGVWESDAGFLLKEQGGQLARISDVSIETEGEGESGTTTLTMTVNTLDGECFIVGGITNIQNKGADHANSGNESNQPDTSNDGESDGNGQDSKPSGSDNKTDSGEKDVKTENKTNVCTISISCAALLDNMDVLPKEKHEFVPTDGLILAPSEVEFEQGESVHDILKRVCKATGIHLESTYTPGYDSAYVEGINQLYEFDGGELSGWMFKVNGWFPNYGVSNYEVSDGDVIEFVYTCDLGKDVGDNSTH